MTRQVLVPAVLAGIMAVQAAPSLATGSQFDQRHVAITQAQSDANLRWARRRIEENIDMLQGDQHDYGGFRVKAISLFQQARRQLVMALQFVALQKQNRLAPTFVNLPDKDMVVLRADCASDANLNVVRRNVERIIDVLQRDLGDYGGHRVAAIRFLNEGRADLRNAIAFDASH